MRIMAVQSLFAWASLDDCPSLGTIRRCLEAIPDAPLLHGLRTARGRGRDDYPVSVLWGVAVLTPLLRHPSYDACLAETPPQSLTPGSARHRSRGPGPALLEPFAVPG